MWPRPARIAPSTLGLLDPTECVAEGVLEVLGHRGSRASAVMSLDRFHDAKVFAAAYPAGYGAALES